MNISKNSWHYRWIDSVFISGPNKSLCTYFWQIIWAICYKVIVFPLTLVLGFFAVILFIGTVIYGPSVLLGNLLFALKIDSAFHLNIGEDLWQYLCSWQVLTFGIGFNFVLFCFLGCIEYRKNCVSKKNSTTLLGSWLRAKKDKVCPIIKFKD